MAADTADREDRDPDLWMVNRNPGQQIARATHPLQSSVSAGRLNIVIPKADTTNLSTGEHAALLNSQMLQHGPRGRSTQRPFLRRPDLTLTTPAQGRPPRWSNTVQLTDQITPNPWGPAATHVQRACPRSIPAPVVHSPVTKGRHPGTADLRHTWLTPQVG